jgi:uncharacterized membrane protein YgaE (UPF0421/DUF939 family)
LGGYFFILLFLFSKQRFNFFIGVSVVTVLDNTVGGFLNLSVQRLMGTVIGGAASIIIMTITRAIFHPNWEWQAAVLLCFLMFIQVFFIAKLKVLPNFAYAGSIVSDL